MGKSESNSGVIALQYLTLTLKFRKAFIKGVHFQALPFPLAGTSRGPTDLLQSKMERGIALVKLANCVGQGHSGSTILIKRLCLMACT